MDKVLVASIKLLATVAALKLKVVVVHLEMTGEVVAAMEHSTALRAGKLLDRRGSSGGGLVATIQAQRWHMITAVENAIAATAVAVAVVGCLCRVQGSGTIVVVCVSGREAPAVAAPCRLAFCST